MKAIVCFKSNEINIAHQLSSSPSKSKLADRFTNKLKTYKRSNTKFTLPILKMITCEWDVEKNAFVKRETFKICQVPETKLELFSVKMSSQP
jgi:hypothetical protein